MKELKKKKRNFIYYAMALCLFLCLVLFLIPQKKISAFAEETEATTSTVIDYTGYGEDDTYTLDDTQYSLYDYPNLIGTKIHIVKDNGYVAENITQNDPIVEIIPEDCFFTVGEHLHIGTEYGFFVHTEEFEENSYSSTALVFDVITNTDLISTVDRVIVTVAPILQYDYVATYTLGDFFSNIEEDITERKVIPVPENLFNPSGFAMSDRYFLQDVCFGATLMNEQTLNYGDVGYNPYDDYGSFFTAMDYAYQGQYWKNGELSIEDLFVDGIDLLFLGLGAKYRAFQKLGNIFTLASDLFSIISNGMSAQSTTIIPLEKRVTATCYYQNRDDQLANYLDEDGKPYLTKVAAIGLNSTETKKLWHGVGDHATAYFTVSHSALNGRPAEYTRFLSNIALKIVDSSGDEIKAISVDSVGHHNVRQPVERAVSADNAEYLYLLPNGKNYFSFTAEYNSTYAVKVNANNAVEMLAGNATATGTEATVYCELAQGETLHIQVNGGEDGATGTLIVKPWSDLENITLSAGEEYLVKTPTLLGVKNISTATDGVVIQGFFTHNGTQFVPFTGYGAFYADTIISYPFPVERTYYVLLKNNTATEKAFALTIEDVPDIRDVNVPMRMALTQNFTYYEFGDRVGGQFVQTISNVQGQNFSYHLLDENFLPISGIASYVAGEWIVSLNANKTYYFGVKTGQAEAEAIIKLNRRQEAYSWRIEGDSIRTIETYESPVYLKHGYTYTVSFMINGEIAFNTLFVNETTGDYRSPYIYTFTSDGVLTIPNTCPVRGSGLIIKAAYGDSQNASYNYTLTVIPDFDGGISNMNISNGDDLILSFTTHKDIQSFTYHFSLNGVTSETYSGVATSYGSAANQFVKDITSDYENSGLSGNGLLSVRITSITVNTIVENAERVYDCSYSISTHSLFYSGDGTSTSPYIVNSPRHFNNLRNITERQSSYVSLQADIELPNNFPTIQNFRGEFNGNNYKVSNLNFSISNNSGNTNYGLFGNLIGIIKNLNLEDVTISNTSGASSHYVGGIVGTMGVSSMIENCTITGLTFNFLMASLDYVGGIIGLNSGTVYNCHVYNANITTSANTGGIAGANEGVIGQCSFQGTINIRGYQEENSFGGIVGYNGVLPYSDGLLVGEVYSCQFNGDIFYVVGKNEDELVRQKIGFIIGWNVDGVQTGNSFNGTHDEEFPIALIKKYLSEHLYKVDNEKIGCQTEAE